MWDSGQIKTHNNSTTQRYLRTSATILMARFRNDSKARAPDGNIIRRLSPRHPYLLSEVSNCRVKV